MFTPSRAAAAAGATVLLVAGATFAVGAGAGKAQASTTVSANRCTNDVASGVLLDETSHALFAAWDDHDAAAAADIYTSDAHMIALDGTYLVGQSAIESYFAAGFAGPLAGTTLIGKPLSMRCLTNTQVSVDGLGAILQPGQTYTDPAQAPVGERFAVSWVGEYQNGCWYFYEFQATFQQS
ncbi:MAG TPA: SgcJ/EcaC family oxidoreductase [Actinospica sp.]|jgi:uncharacterized protein (TIGR02246 family)|nr:SgcJ/EcaC family oxidoreductase [Actinospica sp.]